jgi:phospholipid/cholesterol/gamma-HCH transport system substrate-binding protein
MGRLPERDVRAAASKGGRFRWRPSNATIAIIFLLVFTVGPYLAFTGHVPFTSYGYELKATFSNGVNISANSPVRIAGVDVGRVIGVERDGDATTVTFTVEGKGRPVHDDAFAAIRPRIFLEGNFFIDLSPGSPSAPELGSGDTIPVSHTSTWVQIDEVLTALQAPVRADLSRLLEGYGTALTHKPTAAEDQTQLPEVKGKTAGQALNGAFKYGGDAGRYAAEVTNALLGTKSHDLSRLVAGAGRAFGALGRNEEDLKGLIVNFDTFTGALAAQSTNLTSTVRNLAPALQSAHSSLVSLNETLPPLRAWAIEMKPAVEQLPAWIAAGKPWIKQAMLLLSGKEGGGTAKLLRQATPGFAEAAHYGKALALPQLNRISLCTTKVIVPTGNQVIEDQFSTGQPSYREFLYTLVDFSGWGSNFDGNGPFARLQPGGGNLLVEGENPLGNITTDQRIFAHTIAAPLGTQPQLGGMPPHKPEVRCDSNPVPDLNAGLGQPGAPSPEAITP